MFGVGDNVVYPRHGAGVIEAIEEREVLGRRDLGADYLYLFDGSRWLAYGIPNEPDWVEIKVEK
ncbi:MAG: RNA polymerase-binding transcription factor CarD [Firmicutes bacterium ADurb.Bin506]|nr:MAG: RNA polymerase-binding transcription factor CarD [Firmicutes bacterium ADurb.Bin506]